MATKNASDNQSVGTTGTDYRPSYIVLGVDERGSQQVWDRHTDTVHIVHDDGGRGRRRLDAGTIDDYCEAVGDAIGWQSRRLFGTLADSFELVTIE